MKQSAIYRRDDHTCQYCGNGASSLDHLVPRALGGTDGWDNLVASCGTCNRLKGESHYPDLVESLCFLIHGGRTCDKNYPPLYWQVRTLELLHEPIETNPTLGRWYDRTLIKLAFSEPERSRPFKRRLKLGAIRKLAAVVPHLDALEAEWELERLCQEGRLRATARYYVSEHVNEYINEHVNETEFGEA
jgi:hypothetical protein